MSFEKLFKCLHNDQSHMGDAAENQAMNLSITSSQRHPSPHNKPKISWKEAGLH